MITAGGGVEIRVVCGVCKDIRVVCKDIRVVCKGVKIFS